MKSKNIVTQVYSYLFEINTIYKYLNLAEICSILLFINCRVKIECTY